jgi:hypothetical protein
MLPVILFAQPFLFSSAFSQQGTSKAAETAKIWKSRVENLEDSIQKDSKSIDESERPFYIALLAKVLRRSDKAQSQNYLKGASDAVISDLYLVDKDELTNKLNWARKTAQIIAGVDPRQAEPILNRIAKLLETNGNDSKFNADTYVSTGLQVVDANPDLAYSFGVRSLSYGNSPELFRLILALNIKKTDLGEQLFQLSLAAARKNPDNQFIGNLAIVFLTREGKSFSPRARRAYLELLADLMAKVPLSETDRPANCSASELVYPVLERFDEYLPNLSITIKQELQMCASLSPEKKASGDDAKEPSSVDELLTAAKDTKDRSLKATYYYKALKLLAQQKKYSQIISILDDLPDDERSAIGTTAWESWRIEYAAELVIQAYGEKDTSTVYKTIERSPKNLRPFVRFRFVYKLSPAADMGLYLENLEGIKKELPTAGLLPINLPNSYINLAKLYLKVRRTEVGDLLHNAAKAINAVDSDNPDFLPEKDWSPMNDYVKIPAEFLEADEYSVSSSIAEISSRRSRVRLELGLLESSLKSLSDAIAVAESEKKSNKETSK